MQEPDPFYKTGIEKPTVLSQMPHALLDGNSMPLEAEFSHPTLSYTCIKGRLQTLAQKMLVYISIFFKRGFHMKHRIIVASGILLFIFLISNLLGGIAIITSIKSALMVLGGTLLCSLLAYPLQIFRDLRTSLQELWETKGPDYSDVLSQIENLARLRRVSGPRELNTAGDRTDNIFLQKGIELIVDGYDRHEILCIMEKEYELYFSAKEAQINLMNTLARFAPAFGFVGTIIGLINILNHMEEPSLLGPGMALALLTTLYGLLFANLCFLPLAKKLSEQVRSEALFLNIILEGLIDIAESKNPISIAHRLRSYLNLHMNSHSIRPALLEKVLYTGVPLEENRVPGSNHYTNNKEGRQQHV